MPGTVPPPTLADRCPECCGPAVLPYAVSGAGDTAVAHYRCPDPACGHGWFTGWALGVLHEGAA